MSTEFVEINMGECKIEFFAHDGKKAEVGSGEPIKSFMWQLTGPGIDPTKVRSVEIPKLTYDSIEPLKIKVELEMLEGNVE